MRFFLLMISPLVMLLFSCENKQYINTYSNRIDSLTTILDVSEAIFKNNDTAEIHHQLQYINDLLLKTDSLDNILSGDSVKWVKSIKKGFEEFLSVYPTLNNEMVYAQSQLNGFKHDLEKEYLSEEKTITYFEQEKQSVRVIQLKVDYYNKLIKINNGQYKKLETNPNKKLKNDTP